MSEGETCSRATSFCFVPRETGKWQKLCQVLINERNMTLVCWGFFVNVKKKKVEDKCVKTVKLNRHIVSFVLATYGSVLIYVFINSLIDFLQFDLFSLY